MSEIQTEIAPELKVAAPQKYKQYWLPNPSCNFILKNGKPCVFRDHLFQTASPTEIAELDNEIALGHPMLRVHEEQPYVEILDPTSAYANLMQQMVDKEVARRMSAVNPNNDMGRSDVPVLKPASSFDVAAAMEGGANQISLNSQNIPGTTDALKTKLGAMANAAQASGQPVITPVSNT